VRKAIGYAVIALAGAATLLGLSFALFAGGHEADALRMAGFEFLVARGWTWCRRSADPSVRAVVRRRGESMQRRDRGVGGVRECHPTKSLPANRLTWSFLRFDLELQDFAVIHRAVTVRHVFDRSGAVKDASGLDPAFEHVGQQLLDVGADGCRAAGD
jgi:hypothetical protein